MPNYNIAAAGIGEATRFKPGSTPVHGGKTRGAKDKLSQKFILALAKDFEEHGEKAIVDTREADPAKYLQIIASIVPKDFNITQKSPFDGMSEEEVDAALNLVRGFMADRAGGAGETEDSRPQATAGVH